MGKPVVEKLRKLAEEFGYTFSLYRTASRLHGIGQVRQRSFYFFWKSDRVPVFKYYNKPMEKATDIILNAKVSEDDPMNECISHKKPTDDITYKHILEVVHGGISHAEFIEQLPRTREANSYLEKHYGETYSSRWWYYETWYYLSKRLYWCIRRSLTLYVSSSSRR